VVVSCEIKKMVSMGPYWKPNAFVVNHASMYNCIFTFFSLDEIVLPQVCFCLNSI
jgi:hypothetical protein